ncbi:hypothetical protein HY416_03555 [Candidatus Kaiserbacteria bacterium]|nr:hypothetical protein [Candidatus Kaiserbacteria bacterium]
MSYTKTGLVAGLVVLVGVFAYTADAAHRWSGYHWGRTANPFTLELGDNVSAAWDGYLATAASDWSVSNVLDTVVRAGKTKPRVCKATNGRVEVCNERYGATGWLGIAQIWVGGTHITKGTVKVNDTYFASAPYNTAAWKTSVMCQEIGHTLGLDHQDEDFGNVNLGSCMDYTNDPDGTVSGQADNRHPNGHDYEELAAIYAHLDAVNTVLGTGTSTPSGTNKPQGVGRDTDLDHPSAWGEAVRQDAQGKNALYVRDLGNDEKVFTFVIWAE